MNAIIWLLQWGYAEIGKLYPNVYLLGVALLTGLLLGSSVLVFGSGFTLAFLIGLLAIVIAFTYPEYILLIFLSLVSGIFPSRFNPYLKLAGRGFYLSDFVLLLLLAVVIIRSIAERDFRILKTPLDKPLILFIGAIFVGMGTAILNHGITFSNTTYEARILLYYLIFFPVTNLIRNKTQLNRLIQGILLISVLISLTIVLQALLGRSVSFMDPSILRTEGELVRFYHPGGTVIYFSLIILISDMVISDNRKFRIIRILAILLFTLVIMLELGRNVLISGLISLLLMAYILRRYALSRLGVGLVIITILLSFLLVIPQLGESNSRLFDYLTTFANRISSLFTGSILSPSESLGWRWKEIQFALPELINNPILGLGFETPYRPAFYNGDPLTSYIHVAYLYLWLKTGLLGLVAFVWFSILTLLRGFRYWRLPKDNFLKAVSLGTTLAFLSMMFSNLVAPSFTQQWSLAIFGVLLGVNEVIFSFPNTDSFEKRGEYLNG